ncbi:MAG: glucose-6-phosphate dehydrogenase assembly protein OpcA [Acidobacteriota bacterium]|nr:glucose-6-phosphate dehydrogenase assembly protein OpcA [Acidobacteriota bacterium]
MSAVAETVVRPENLLKDLARLWVDLGRQDNGSGTSGVIRACAMTLIAAVDCEDDAKGVTGIIGQLMHEHPSRAIVLCIGRGNAPITARVFAQCWMPFGGRQQICCEQIEIAAGIDMLPDLPKLLLGITVPDLPVVLWSRSPSLCENTSFVKLFPLADKVIFDSERFEDKEAGLALVKSLPNSADLAWARLTTWRETVAQIFENVENRNHLAGIDRVVISMESVGARYLKAWFGGIVPAGGPAAVRGGRPTKIEMSGHGFSASVRLVEPSSAEVVVNGIASRTQFPASSEYNLMREELSILGVDAVFRRCLP